jgi:hypothetical protein
MPTELGRRFRPRWVAKDKGAFCHQQRCNEPAVSFRLCAAHGAHWLSHNKQPPMPEYEADHVDPVEALEKDTREAERERKAMAALPMRNHNDASAMRDQLVGARALIEQTQSRKQAAIDPLLAEVRRLSAAFDGVIAAYRTCEELALTRLDQFTHLHDFEVAKPSKSGIPPRPQARQSAAPRVTKAKKRRHS